MLPRLSAILLLTMFLSGFTLSKAIAVSDQASASFIATANSAPIPAFLIEDAKQQTVRLQDLHGHWVLLNVWATWCGPCVREMPALDKLAATFDAKRLVIIALNENSSGHDVTSKFYQDHNLSHLALYVDQTGRAPSLIKAKGLPTTLLINPKGIEVGRWEGAVDWASPKIANLLNEKIMATK